MKKFIILGVLISCVSSVWAEGNAENGEKISGQICIACHAADGNSAMGMYPKIAGQHHEYLVASLKEYRKAGKGRRNNPVMTLNAVNLSDQDIEDLATYFAGQEMSPGGAAEQLVALGGALYKGGNKESGVPACLACHGPDGMGVASAMYPRIGGQQAEYLIDALKAYRSLERQDLREYDMMNMIAAKMTDEEIQAVSSYISGLHTASKDE